MKFFQIKRKIIIKLVLLCLVSLGLFFSSQALAGNDLIGLRVYSNHNHLSPSEWYLANVEYPGSPGSIQVDGYEAVQDGRTVYVAAANKSSNPTPPPADIYYTNIYLISYNESAIPETVNIFNQLIDSWYFNTNISSTSTKAKIIRDTKRLADLQNIAESINTYGQNHSYCNISTNIPCPNGDDDCPEGQECSGPFYPSLEAGTFILGQSTSKWPSWQQTLAPALSATLAIDPVNEFLGCTEAPEPPGSGYDPQTCWNEITNQFECVTGSRLYYYSNYSEELENDYRLTTLAEEFDDGQGEVQVPPNFDLGGLDEHINISGRIRTNTGDFDMCQASSGLGTYCGNGVVECQPGNTSPYCDINLAGSDEECEPGMTRPYCDDECPQSQQNWHLERVSGCNNDCKWFDPYPDQGSEIHPNAEECLDYCGGWCGNNNLEGPWEECDGSEFIPGWSCVGGEDLLCDNNCQIYCDNGTPPYQGECGNSVLEYPEQCETNFTYAAPTPANSSETNQYECDVITTGCVSDGGWCGDNICQSAFTENYNNCISDCPPPSGTIFASSLLYNGNLLNYAKNILNPPYTGYDSLGAADYICQQRSNVSGNKVRDGIWRTWISANQALVGGLQIIGNDVTASGNRLFDYGATSGDYTYYYLFSGFNTVTKVADHLTDIRTADPDFLEHAININELGNPVPSNNFVWTGTFTTGNVLSGNTCENWTSALSTDVGRTGNANEVDQDWTAVSSSNFCNNSYRLYCLYQGPTNQYWPNAPYNQSVTELGNSTLRITWQDNSSDPLNENGFEIYRRSWTASGGFTNYILVTTTGPNITTYDDSLNLVLGPTYYYKIRAKRTFSSQTYYSYFSNVVGKVILCGNGNTDPGEACDDGQQGPPLYGHNGQTGFCNLTCTGIAGICDLNSLFTDSFGDPSKNSSWINGYSLGSTWTPQSIPPGGGNNMALKYYNDVSGINSPRDRRVLDSIVNQENVGILVRINFDSSPDPDAVIFSRHNGSNINTTQNYYALWNDHGVGSTAKIKLIRVILGNHGTGQLASSTSSITSGDWWFYFTTQNESGNVRLRAKWWLVGSAMPQSTWNYDILDSAANRITGAGRVGVAGWTGTAANPNVFYFDNFQVCNP